MKTKIIALVSLLFVGLLAGCNSAAQLNNVRIGMSKDQVIALLGTPDSTSAQANVEYMTYFLENGADVGYNRDRAYMVRLVDGKVESFGRFAQLFDLYNRPVTSAQPGESGFPTAGNAINGMIVAPGAGGPASAPGLADQLQKLKRLKDQGVLTDEEFQRAKTKLLSDEK